MLTGELRSKIDAIWNAFWSGGIANPRDHAELERLREEGLVLRARNTPACTTR